MAIKFTSLGLLIYATMLAYLGAFGAFTLRRRKLAQALYFTGFMIAMAGLVVRWFQVGHVPLQNLFEVFLCLGMLAYPLSVFCRRCLDVGCERGDVLMAFIVLFPAGFIFEAQPQKLPPALQTWLFAPHVAAYVFAYMILFKAGVQERQVKAGQWLQLGGAGEISLAADADDDLVVVISMHR